MKGIINIMSEIGNGEIDSPESGYSEVTESDNNMEIDGELDDVYDKYLDNISEYEFTESLEKKEINEEAENNDSEDDLFEPELDRKYNEYIENMDETGNRFHELSEEDKREICEETGWSKSVIDMMDSREEVETYKNANLKEAEINGKKCLIRFDIDMEQRDEFGHSNKERIENGNSPLTKSGEKVELHHIGQREDSPLAELTMQEHRSKGNDAVLHDKQKESEVDHNKFARERKQYWKSRAENL